MKHLYLLALCLLVSTTCWSEEKLKHNLTYSFPGGVAELILDKQSDTLPEIKFGALLNSNHIQLINLNVIAKKESTNLMNNLVILVTTIPNNLTYL